jgi:hypothetical protein
MSVVKELEEWAESITEVEDETTKTLAEPAADMLDEAPGAETLAHDDATEKSNLKAFDLDEGVMKQAIWDDAEKMSLDQFIEKYGDDDFAKEFWHSVNSDDEEQLGEGPADEPVEPDMDADDKRFDDDDSNAWFGADEEEEYEHYYLKSTEDVEEGLDANQKRVGQLGPTEKVKNNNIGKLVGANENREFSDLKRLAGLK